MVSTSTKAKRQEKPWLIYKMKHGSRDKLFEPGWAGSIDSDECERLQQALTKDPDLAYWWGWRPGLKRRAVAAIERVAMNGDPDNRSHNVKLVREAGRRPRENSEDDSTRVTKDSGLDSSLGRPRIESWESEMLKLASSGWGVKRIAQRLRNSGMDISHVTVARRLEEIRGQLAMSL